MFIDFGWTWRQTTRGRSANGVQVNGAPCLAHFVGKRDINGIFDSENLFFFPSASLFRQEQYFVWLAAP